MMQAKFINLPKPIRHEHGHEQNRFAVIPMPARLDADENYTGRDLTIAFLDSGASTHMRPGKLIFVYHDDDADSVALAGDFNNWVYENAQFESAPGGLWRLEIESPRAGRYCYKLVVDGKRWVDDPANGLKEPDEFGGFNSLVNIN